jgi:hypothetical protein
MNTVILQVQFNKYSGEAVVTNLTIEESCLQVIDGGSSAQMEKLPALVG